MSANIITSVRSAAAQALRGTAGTRPLRPGESEFGRLLRSRLEGQKIAISAHAADRMARRGIVPDERTVRQLETAFQLASEKGSREALFLLDGMAVVASVSDRTVKTALDPDSLSAGVFTNIDAAVVLSSHVPKASDNNNHPLNQSPRSLGWAPNGEAAIQNGGLPL